MITTTKGDMEESLLEKRTGWSWTTNEFTTWVEYWLGEELVHRSAHITLKESVFGSGEAANLV